MINKKRVPAERTTPAETLYRQISQFTIPAGLLAFGSSMRFDLPIKVNPDSGWL